MPYTKPTISAAFVAAGAIQSGSAKPSNLAVDNDGMRIQTPAAYEADE
jgi:hypothetical protein